MNIRKFLENTMNTPNAADAQIELDGWLVIIGGFLYLLDEELPEDYRQAVKIKISDENIIYAIRQAILPLGGGESFVFHKAKVTGILVLGVPPEIVANSLYIQERGHDEMVFVDITPAAVGAAKARYEAAINFDFFKEMGDT